MCLVKSSGSHEVLLRGDVGIDGLYKFTNFHLLPKQSPSLSSSFSNNVVPLSCNDSSFLTVNTSHVPLNTWHLRLGHPNIDTLRLVLQNCNHPIGNKTSIDSALLVVLESLIARHLLLQIQCIKILLNSSTLICGVLPHAVFYWFSLLHFVY